MGGPTQLPQVTAVPPQNDKQGGGTAAPTAAPSNFDAGQQAAIGRALPRITEDWKKICGVLLTDVEPIPAGQAPVIETFKQECYTYFARPRTTALAGLQEVYDVLSLTESRKKYYLALEEMQRAAALDDVDRNEIHKVLLDLAEGGQLQYCTDRALAHYANLTSWGRAWWKGSDALPWVSAFASYLQSSATLVEHATYGLAIEQQGAAIGQRTRGLIAIMNLLTKGNLAGKEETKDAAGTEAKPDDAREKQFRDQAKAIKDKIEPYLPPVHGGKAPKLDYKDYKKYETLVVEIKISPIEVRDIITSDAEFMRRVALLGEQEMGPGYNGPMTITGALDPMEALFDQVIGWTYDKDGNKVRPERQRSESEQFETVRAYLARHLAEADRDLRMKMMTHPRMVDIHKFLSQEHQRELWRLATRGNAKQNAEDRLYEAIKLSDTAGAARALLAMGADDRDRIQQLQDDPMFRSAIASEAMKTSVEVDGIMVKPYDLCLIMWGRRPSDTSDPGLTAGTEENTQVNQDPLKVSELKLLDDRIYNPVIKGLEACVSYNSKWYTWGSADGEIKGWLGYFQNQCMQPDLMPLIQRGRIHPGQELATKYHARTGKSLLEGIKTCGADTRRRCEEILNYTIDSATVGTVGGVAARAGDKPDDAEVKLEQALRETPSADNLYNCSHWIHEKAVKLKAELDECWVSGRADEDDCKAIWDELTAKVTNEQLSQVAAKTKRRIHLIELLSNAYQAIDGPLVRAMGKALDSDELPKIKAYYGLTDGEIAAREAEGRKADGLDKDPREAATEAGDAAWKSPAEALFRALGALDNRSDEIAFYTVRTQLGVYERLAPNQPIPTQAPRKPTKESPADLTPGSGVPVPTEAIDYYRLNYGITPKNHAIQVCRGFRPRPVGISYLGEVTATNGNVDDYSRAEYVNLGADKEGHTVMRKLRTPEEVAVLLGIEPSLVQGAVQAPPASEKPVVDETNLKLVRPGFTSGTAEDLAKDIWRLLHDGGELHLIQAMLYGPYNDEEQRLIRLAFRQLSGGIDWQFYVQQARLTQGTLKSGGDYHHHMVGAEGTAEGQKVATRGYITITGDSQEKATAMVVATQGFIDIRSELRDAVKRENMNEIFRIVDKMDDAQCRAVLNDKALLGEIYHVCDQYAYDRVLRTLQGSDGLAVRLESRSHGEYGTSERLFGGTDEKGMTEDIKAYVHRLRLKIEAELRAEQRKSPRMPNPAEMQVTLRIRLREACRQLASNPDIERILVSELDDDGQELAQTRDLLITEGQGSNVTELSRGGKDEQILTEIRQMSLGERQRRLRDPEFMQRLTKELQSPADLQAAMALLQSTSEATTGEDDKATGRDKLAALSRKAAAMDGGRDMLRMLVELGPADHELLMRQPELVSKIMWAMRRARPDEQDIAMRVLQYRREDAYETLGKGVVFPDAQGETCEGRTLPQAEQERLAFLQHNAVQRLAAGASGRGSLWENLLREATEVFKMDLRPRGFTGTEPGAAEPTVEASALTPKKDGGMNAALVDSVEQKIRLAIWEQAYPSIKRVLDDEDTKNRTTIIKAAVLHVEGGDPSTFRMALQWGANDDEADVVDILKRCSDDHLVTWWTSIAEDKIKPNGEPSMWMVFDEYRKLRDGIGQQSLAENDPQRVKLNDAKSKFMNYVIDVSDQFEAEILHDAGSWTDNSDRTVKDQKRSRIRERKNDEYLSWRKIVRDRIPKLPKALIAKTIGATKPDDIALIDNPNRQHLTAVEFREGEYLRKMGTQDPGMRVADNERAVVNNAMTRYGREAADVLSNKEGGHGIVTAGEAARVERTGEEVDRAMREFSAARARIAGWASAIAALVVGAILTIVTGGAGSGIAWMLVASAISGAGGALAGAMANKAIQGSEYDFGGEGMLSVVEGAVTGMITAGSTKMAEGIMKTVAGPATMKAQLEAMERMSKGLKPTTWQSVVSGAKGMGYAATEEMLSEGITMGLEGLVPLHPGVYVDSWDEGIIKGVSGVRTHMHSFEERLLVAGAAAALTHGMGGVVGKIRGEKVLKSDPASEQIRGHLRGHLERMRKNMERYFEIDEVMLEAFASFVVERSADVIQGRPINWGALPEDLLKAFIQEYTELASEVHTGHYRVGHKRHKQIETELRQNGERLGLRQNERKHFEELNDSLGIGKVITVEEYMVAREGMFEARVAMWENELGRKLTPGERRAFQDYCRGAKDSPEYTKRLNTLPTSIDSVRAAGFTSGTSTDDGLTDDQRNDGNNNNSNNNNNNNGGGDGGRDGGRRNDRGGNNNESAPKLTADQMKTITGEVDPLAGSTFKATMRGTAEPGKVMAAAEAALPHVAAMFPGKVEVAGPQLLRVSFEGGTFLVSIQTMVAETDKVATYQFTGVDSAVIKISDEIRDKHAERAIAHMVAEMIARRESMAGKGQELAGTDALTKGGTSKQLSIHDLGKVAQLRVLLRQLNEAEHPKRGGKPNPVEVGQLTRDLDVLMASMGLDGSVGAERIDDVLKPLLNQWEQNALRVHADKNRRDQLRSALPEHAGVEVHNHFLGVVDAQEFADKAVEAEARRKGVDKNQITRSGFEIMLDQIAAIGEKGADGKPKNAATNSSITAKDEANLAHARADGSKLGRDDVIGKGERGKAGDAIVLAMVTKQVLDGTLTQLPNNAPKWLSDGAAEMGRLQDSLRKATDRNDPKAIDEATKALTEKRHQLAELAVRVAMTATDDTDFNSGYEIIDHQIKMNWGDGGDRAKAYEQFAESTVRQLILDKLSYEEQTNSFGKLNNWFGKELMDRVVWKVTAAMVKSGEITEKDVMHLRQLSLIPTAFFGKEETYQDEMTEDQKAARAEAMKPENWAKRDDKGNLVGGMLYTLVKQLTSRSDVVGIDIAGAETARFTEKVTTNEKGEKIEDPNSGQARFEELFRELVKVAQERGRPIVLRPHVGEGFGDPEVGKPQDGTNNRRQGADDEASHYDRSRNNIEVILKALESVGYQAGGPVIVRFGHATHTTPAMARRMAKMGIIAEVNLHSNIDTQSLDQRDPKTKRKADQERFEDHSLLTLILYRVQTILSTDGHAVMHTDMAAEYERAHRIIEEFLQGRSVVRVDAEDPTFLNRGKERVIGEGTPTRTAVRELSRGDLSEGELKLFLGAYDQLHQWAKQYESQAIEAEKKDILMWQDLAGLATDPKANNKDPDQRDPGKHLHFRDLVRRLCTRDGVVDESAISTLASFDGGRYASLIPNIRALAQSLLVEADASEAAKRWQTHGINEFAKATGTENFLDDPEFKRWYDIWFAMPNRIKQKSDGMWEPIFPTGMDPRYQDQLRTLVQGQMRNVNGKDMYVQGNVILTEKVMLTATDLAEHFPELTGMDPESKAWEARRTELIRRYGQEQVVKYEQAVTGKRGGEHRAEMDARLEVILDEKAMKDLKAMFPGCEVFITGSAVQPGKPLKFVADLDLVVITPESWTARQRADFEEAFNKKEVMVPTSEVFAKMFPKPRTHLPADVKIMSPREGFGMIAQTPEFDPQGGNVPGTKERTGHDPDDPKKQRLRSLDYLRLDVEPTTEKPEDKPGVTRNPKLDADGDGIQDAARVGVPGRDVPTAIPRLDNLTQGERDAESRFAAEYEKDGGKDLAERYLKKVANHTTDKMTFATDDAKALSKDYNPDGMQDKVDALREQLLDPSDPKKEKLLTPDKMTPAQLRIWEELVPVQEKLFTARGLHNAAVHQTANAVAKQAFLLRLDQIKDDPSAKKQVLITAGGVGAGKSFSIKNNDEAARLKADSSVIWDSAGEQNSTELPWVLEEAQKRGLTVAIIYVHKRPEQSWENMKFGVTPRAKNESGRMVDARLHADSYAEGARNFDAFQKQWAGTDGVKFVVLDATDETKKAEKIDHLPDDALTLDADKVHMRNVAFLESQRGMPDRITGPGGDLGERVWGDAGNVEQLNEQWKKDNIALVDRARRAHEIHAEMRKARRDALNRQEPEAVKAMRQRSKALYGNYDGPTFDQLVTAYKGWGLNDDQAYEAIILGPM